MKWGIKADARFPSLFEFKNSFLRNCLDLHYRSRLLAEKKLGLVNIHRSVLDFGAGSQDFHERHPKAEYFSLDPHCSATWSSLEQIPAEKKFDLIVALEVFEHLKDPATVLAQLARHQDPGQQIYLTTPFLAREHGAPEDFQRWTGAGLVELLEKAGYRVETTEYRGGFISVLSSFVNYWFFQKMNSVWFLPTLVFTPFVMLLLVFAHWDLCRSAQSSFYLGVSLLAVKERE